MLKKIFIISFIITQMFSIVCAEDNKASHKPTAKDYESMTMEQLDDITAFGIDGKERENRFLKEAIKRLNDFDDETTFDEYKKNLMTLEQVIAFVSNLTTDKNILAEIKKEGKTFDSVRKKQFDEFKKFTKKNKIHWPNVQIEGFDRSVFPIKEISKHYIYGYVFFSVGNKYYRASMSGIEHDKECYLIYISNFTPSEKGVTEYELSDLIKQ